MKGPAVEILPGTVNQNMMGSSLIQEPDFSEFMWMGDELDEFDKQINAELERDFMEFCQNEMNFEEIGYFCEQDDDEADWFYAEDYEKWKQAHPEGFESDIYALYFGDVEQPLNPMATEFVPRCIQPFLPYEQERAQCRLVDSVTSTQHTSTDES